jgi:hypothetical protein
MRNGEFGIWSKHSIKFFIIVFLAFLAVIPLFGFTAAEGRESSPAAFKNSMDYAVYVPVAANRLKVRLVGILRAADVCADCCSLLTVKYRDSVYELIPDESYTKDLAVYDDHLVQIMGQNDGFCSLSGRPIVKVSDIWPISPFST